MSAAPRVSIMMPVYNAGRYLGEAIESVLAQTYPDWELIIVDDGSTDDSPVVAGGFSDARLRIVRQENAGEAAARNIALGHVRGDLLAFLDADDRLLPDHLALTVAYLDAHPEADGVYTDGYHIHPDGRRMPQALSDRRRGPFEGDLFEALVRASDVFGPPMCVVLRSAGVQARRLAFDPEIIIGPDWDFFTRFSEHARFGYLPERTCEYRIHQTNITVQTGMDRRRGYLARCREKAIHLNRFDACSVETRAAVFYDLLVALLAGRPERQAAVLSWPQFARLPAAARARLLRLLAADAVVAGAPACWPAEWLAQAAALQPGYLPGRALAALHRLHPALLRAALRLRRGPQSAGPPTAPFADLYDNL